MTRPPRIVDRLLWQQSLSPRAAWVWFVLVILSPLTLAGGMWLHYKVSERRGVQITATRAEAIESAREYARQYGIPVVGWSQAMWVNVDGSLEHYLNLQPPERRHMLED